MRKDGEMRWWKEEKCVLRVGRRRMEWREESKRDGEYGEGRCGLITSVSLKEKGLSEKRDEGIRNSVA